MTLRLWIIVVFKILNLELYLDELRVDININLDVLNIRKGNEFHYLNLTPMAHDILSIPISIIVYESIFNIDNWVFDQFLSALKSNVVEH